MTPNKTKNKWLYPSLLAMCSLLACGVETNVNYGDGGLSQDSGNQGTDTGSYDAGTQDAGTQDAGIQDAGGGDDGGTIIDGGQDAGPNGDDGGQIQDGGYQPDIDICDEVNMTAHGIPPNLLLVVDKSGSMMDPTQQGGTRTKIQDTKDALEELLDWGENHIRFGWMHFPRLGGCNPGQIDVECDENTAQEIRQIVQFLLPTGGTPTGETLQVADAYQGLYDESRGNFVVLLTDGLPTCPTGEGSEPNDSDNQLALDAVVSLHAHNIDTFVIGLGEDLNSANPDLLNDMAEAGGRARPGAVKYYQANNLADLQDVLDNIGEQVMSCDLQLDIPPDIPSWLWVYFDGQPVMPDPTHQDGWDYDETLNQIHFYGPTCDRLRSGQVTLVEVKVGCGPPV